jgi:hypothetical protein
LVALNSYWQGRQRFGIIGGIGAHKAIALPDRNASTISTCDA